MTHYLSTTTAALLKQQASFAEKSGQLSPEQLEIIYSNKWFNLFVPQSFGGLEMDLINGLKLQEELAHLDGSLGWTVTLVSGANAFFGFFSPEQWPLIYSNTKVCCAGSGAIKGVAREIDGGYLIDGQWSYVSGTAHATVFTANCQIEKDGVRLVDQNGLPVYKSFFFFPEEVQVIKDWNSMGMAATSSHSFSVRDLRVDANRSFSINVPAVDTDYKMDRYPFIATALLTLTVNHLGMQRHFLDLAQPILQSATAGKFMAFRHQLWEAAHLEIEANRSGLFAWAEASWSELEQTGTVSDQQILQIEQHCKMTVKKGREALLQIYPYLGMIAADKQSELNRVLRDLLTASQHTVLL